MIFTAKIITPYLHVNFHVSVVFVFAVLSLISFRFAFWLTFRLADALEPDRRSQTHKDGACRPVRRCGFGRQSESDLRICPRALPRRPNPLRQMRCYVLLWGRDGAQDARKTFLFTL